jgi:uncharacterized membrane protein YidH (DUF202 family)
MPSGCGGIVSIGATPADLRKRLNIACQMYTIRREPSLNRRHRATFSAVGRLLTLLWTKICMRQVGSLGPDSTRGWEILRENSETIQLAVLAVREMLLQATAATSAALQVHKNWKPSPFLRPFLERTLTQTQPYRLLLSKTTGRRGNTSHQMHPAAAMLVVAVAAAVMYSQTKKAITVNFPTPRPRLQQAQAIVAVVVVVVVAAAAAARVVSGGQTGMDPFTTGLTVLQACENHLLRASMMAVAAVMYSQTKKAITVNFPTLRPRLQQAQPIVAVVVVAATAAARVVSGGIIEMDPFTTGLTILQACENHLFRAAK